MISKFWLLHFSAFFWLLSLLFSSILWFAVVPLREQLAFGLVFSIIFQELFRFGIYALLSKADAYLKKLTENEETLIFANKHILAYGKCIKLIVSLFTIVAIFSFFFSCWTWVWNDVWSLFPGQYLSRQFGTRNSRIQWRASRLFHDLRHVVYGYDPLTYILGRYYFRCFRSKEMDQSCLRLAIAFHCIVLGKSDKKWQISI